MGPTPVQLPFWNLWDFPMFSRLYFRHSYSVTLERCAVSAHQVPPVLEPVPEPSTRCQELDEEVSTGQVMEEEQPEPMLAPSSSSPDDTGSSGGISPPPDDYKAHQELLKTVVLSLGTQVEDVKASSHHLVDILATENPPRVILPVNKAVIDPIEPLWQIPLSLIPPSKSVKCKYYASSQCQRPMNGNDNENTG